MFGVLTKKMSKGEIAEFISEKFREQSNYEYGNRDYSFINELGEENARSEASISFQELIIGMVVNEAIKNAIYESNIVYIGYAIKDLETLPLYKSMQRESLLPYVERLDKLKNTFILSNKTIEDALNELEEEAWELWETVQKIGSSVMEILSTQPFYLGKDEPKTAKEAIEDLQSMVFKDFIMEDLINAKKMLIAFSLVYNEAYVDNPIENPDGSIMDNQFDLYYTSPYFMLFETDGVSSLEVLISKIIIYIQNDVDKNTIRELKEFISQNKNKSDFHKKLAVIEELLVLYDDSAKILELKTILKNCI